MIQKWFEQLRERIWKRQEKVNRAFTNYGQDYTEGWKDALDWMFTQMQEVHDNLALEQMMEVLK